MKEVEWPIENGYKAPEVDKIKRAEIIKIVELDAKEVVKAKKLNQQYKDIGQGEAEAAILFQRGGYESIIVADIRAQRKLKEIGIVALDLVDVAFVVRGKSIMNPREFSKRYWRASYRR